MWQTARTLRRRGPPAYSTDLAWFALRSVAMAAERSPSRPVRPGHNVQRSDTRPSCVEVRLSSSDSSEWIMQHTVLDMVRAIELVQA